MNRSTAKRSNLNNSTRPLLANKTMSVHTPKTNRSPVGPSVCWDAERRGTLMVSEYSTRKCLKIILFDIYYLPHLRMFDQDWGSDKLLSLEGKTETSSPKAPLQHPLESQELPPELVLEKSEWIETPQRFPFEKTSFRRKSLDEPYSILGFMERRLSDKRGRINSQTLSNKNSTLLFP